jgi:hypothetical protein
MVQEGRIVLWNMEGIALKNAQYVGEIKSAHVRSAMVQEKLRIIKQSANQHMDFTVSNAR